jgi:hypothetical protein
MKTITVAFVASLAIPSFFGLSAAKAECRITDINYHYRVLSRTREGSEFTVYIDVQSKPADTSRDIDGYVCAYYEYFDPDDGEDRRDKACDQVNGHAAGGEATTTIPVDLTSIHPGMEDVYDIKFMRLVCE